MSETTYQLPLTFEQILELVQQLPTADQYKLFQSLNLDYRASQSSRITQNHQNPKPVQYRSKAFRDLIEQVEPVVPEFDPDQAKADYLAEKYSL